MFTSLREWRPPSAGAGVRAPPNSAQAPLRRFAGKAGKERGESGQHTARKQDRNGCWARAPQSAAGGRSGPRPFWFLAG